MGPDRLQAPIGERTQPNLDRVHACGVRDHLWQANSTSVRASLLWFLLIVRFDMVISLA